MKLKSKITLLLAATWLAIFILGSVLPIIFLNGGNLPLLHFKYLILPFIFISLFCIILLAILLYTMIVDRIIHINNQLNEINDHQIPHHANSDEITSLSHKIQHLSSIVNFSKSDEFNNETISLEALKRSIYKYNDDIYKLLNYDQLTSLPNSVFFMEILSRSISHAKRNNKTLALLFIDVDKFRNILEEHGRQYTDQILMEFSNRLTKLIRSGDVVSRIGNDQFMILLNDIAHPKFGGTVADKILQSCEQPIHFQNKVFSIKVSIGVSIYPNDGLTIDDLETNAYLAVRKAKESGGGIYTYYTNDMDIEAHEYMLFESALRHAIINNQLVLFYQPQINIKDGTVKSVEALIRWNHPKFGLLDPEKFIPLAEQSNFIIQIGEWALHKACITNQKWQKEGYGPITIAVNLSPKQFRSDNIDHVIASTLAATQLNPHYLELEITESAVMEDVDFTANKLNKIHAMGVNISIDDFGTGYTSISYLRKFPVNILKIDKSFIQDLPHNQNDAAITSALIALGHNLSLKVVAEGVENVEQVQFLANHGCDCIQGYFFSGPIPEDKLVLLLKKNNVDKK